MISDRVAAKALEAVRIEEPAGPDVEEAGKAVSQPFEEPVSSAEAAEDGNASEEASAGAGIEEPKQKRRCVENCANYRYVFENKKDILVI